LIEVLSDFRVPAIEYLGRGSTGSEIDGLTAEHGISLNRETREWFSLVGGPGPSIPPDLALMFSPEFVPVSLSFALERRAWLLDKVGPSGPEDLRLEGIDLFMPMSAGPPMHCAVQGRGDTAPVHWFSTQDAHDTYMIEMWPSIEAMVTGWLYSWESGSFVYEPNGVVVLDPGP
jgi:hypothetical protein